MGSLTPVRQGLAARNHWKTVPNRNLAAGRSGFAHQVEGGEAARCRSASTQGGRLRMMEGRLTREETRPEPEIQSAIPCPVKATSNHES